MQEVGDFPFLKFARKVLAATVAMLLAGSVAGQAGAPKLPPQVQHELMSLVKTCRDAGGKPGKSPALLVIADVTGDRVADFIIDQGSFNCDGAADLFSGVAGSQVVIYAGTGKGQVAKVFDQGVVEVKVDKGASPAAIKVMVAGALCGQRTAGKAAMSKAKTCWRPLLWNASKKRMELGPLSRE
jgi:hypothetical protein